MNIYFGDNLKTLREKRGLTQSRLADFLGVSFQTVSKWERGETYPDITILPIIANFFGVSVDSLLGVNKAENERKIKEYIALFDSTYFSDADKLIKEFENAAAEFPNDFRILVRYMELLTETKDKPFIKNSAESSYGAKEGTNNPYELGFFDNPEYDAVSQKIQSIYNAIQNQCTDDDIRIRSKRIMIKHLMIRYELSFDKRTNKWRCDNEAYEKARKIQSSLPSISDSRECIAVCASDDLSTCSVLQEEAIEELLFHLQSVMRGYIYFNEQIPIEYKIEKIKQISGLLEMCEKEDYISKNEIHLMLNYGQLSYLGSQTGNYDEAFYYLEKCIDCAVKLDNNPTELEKIARFYNLERPLASGSMRGRIKLIITENYPFSEEFKANKKFNSLLERL